ncbi:MAG: tetratricopeptide repeat protein [Blastochloris sp.]|nr:tetratricopeptide repeat protein [Blastochloris sp.]
MSQPFASPEDPRIIDGDENEISKILRPLLLVLTLVLIGVAIFIWFRSKLIANEEKARVLLIEAKTPEDWRNLVEAHPLKSSSALALISLAQEANSRRDFAQAVSCYEDFLERFPHHPMSPSVNLALAVAHENMGQQQEAIAAYVKMRDSQPPHAHVGTATILLAKNYLRDDNKVLAARQTLADFISGNSESPVLNEARELLNSLPPVK